MDGTNDSFRWPDCPPYPHHDWFLVTGAELGLEPDQIRFAAALITLGGPDSKNNSVAARTAGMELTRVQAFRLARSVKVRKLIDNAEQIKQGKRKPLTEEQIDERVDKMCMSPNDRDAATGIKLRDDRKAARLRADDDELSTEQAIYDVIALIPQEEVGAFLSMCAFHSKVGSIHNFRFLKECAPAIKARYPKQWNEWRCQSHLWTKHLDDMANGPLLQGRDLVAAVKAGLPPRVKVNPTVESSDASRPD
jgi:hypothetical protein